MDLSAIIQPVVAIGGMGLLFGVGLGVAAKKFAVPVDERVTKVLENLPGANCGGCGKAGCEAMAKAMVNGDCGVDACPVCQAKQIQAIAAVLGLVAEEKEKQIAYVRCQGGKGVAEEKFIYEGPLTCQDAQLVGGGPKMCSFGCLGLGSCEQTCHFHAITMKDGLPQINTDLCTGCGACARQCPRSVIALVPISSNYHVNCISKERGKAVKEACKAGCLGCGLCVKQCEYEAISLQDNHAVIDPSKCQSCGKCEEKCPTKAITHLMEVAVKKEESALA